MYFQLGNRIKNAKVQDITLANEVVRKAQNYTSVNSSSLTLVILQC